MNWKRATRRSAFIGLVWCAVFVGYMGRGYVEHRYHHISVNAGWLREARLDWTGLSSWTDEQIVKNISTEPGFRAAFPQYSMWTDEEVGKIGRFGPPPHGYVFERDSIKNLPDKPAGITMAAIPQIDFTKYLAAEKKIDLSAGMVPKQGQYTDADVQKEQKFDFSSIGGKPVDQAPTVDNAGVPQGFVQHP